MMFPGLKSLPVSACAGSTGESATRPATSMSKELRPARAPVCTVLLVVRRVIRVRLMSHTPEIRATRLEEILRKCALLGAIPGESLRTIRDHAGRDTHDETEFGSGRILLDNCSGPDDRV